MAGLATAAEVSRQLVYAHFADLPTLVRELLTDRFGALDEAVAAAVADAAGPASARFAAQLMLSLAPADRYILRALLLQANTPEHELAGLAVTVRNRMIDRWATALGGADEPDSRAVAWALINAHLGVADLVDAGTITPERAVDQLARLAAASASAQDA